MNDLVRYLEYIQCVDIFDVQIFAEVPMVW